MKQYKVYKNPLGNLEAVKQGWSWPAFFFSFIWAMVKKMWVLGIGVIIGIVVFAFAVAIVIGLADGSDADAHVLFNIVSIIANIIFGIYGNSWRGTNLVSRGYELADTVTAANREGAQALYLKTEQSERQQVA